MSEENNDHLPEIPSSKISIVTGCYNEAGIILELYERLIAVLRHFPEFTYEIIVADNCSTDGTRDLLRKIAAQDKNFKVILNSNNFGPIRSGYNAFMKAGGDAVVLMSSDLQDPPEVVGEFIRKWQEGYQVVTGVISNSQTNPVLSWGRRFYYKLLSKFSDTDHVIQNFTGFGLYDKKFMDAVRLFRDPVPYFRGFVSEIGFRRATVNFIQPKRKHGQSKHNFFTLYSYAITGFVNHSKLPLRLATFAGFCLAGINLVVAFLYFIYKLVNWETFTVGVAPIVIGLFFFSAVQLIFIGIVGEYIGEILTQVKNRPLAIVDETINLNEQA